MLDPLQYGLEAGYKLTLQEHHGERQWFYIVACNLLFF